VDNRGDGRLCPVVFHRGVVMLKWIMLGIGGAIVVAVIIFGIVEFAGAQTPEARPDIPLLQAGGIYPMSCIARSERGDDG
jgi:hypothetical protein